MNVKSILGLLVVFGVGTGVVLAHAGEPQGAHRPVRAVPACAAFHDSLSARLASPMHDSLMGQLHGVNHDSLLAAFGVTVPEGMSNLSSSARQALHDSMMTAIGQMPCDSLITHLRAMHGDSIFAAFGVPLPDSLELQDPEAARSWLQRVHNHLYQFFSGMHGHHDSEAPTAH